MNKKELNKKSSKNNYEADFEIFNWNLIPVIRRLVQAKQ